MNDLSCRSDRQEAEQLYFKQISQLRKELLDEINSCQKKATNSFLKCQLEVNNLKRDIVLSQEVLKNFYSQTTEKLENISSSFQNLLCLYNIKENETIDQHKNACLLQYQRATQDMESFKKDMIDKMQILESNCQKDESANNNQFIGCVDNQQQIEKEIERQIAFLKINDTKDENCDLDYQKLTQIEEYIKLLERQSESKQIDINQKVTSISLQLQELEKEFQNKSFVLQVQQDISTIIKDSNTWKEQLLNKINEYNQMASINRKQFEEKIQSIENQFKNHQQSIVTSTNSSQSSKVENKEQIPASNDEGNISVQRDQYQIISNQLQSDISELKVQVLTILQQLQVNSSNINQLSSNFSLYEPQITQNSRYSQQQQNISQIVGSEESQIVQNILEKDQRIRNYSQYTQKEEESENEMNLYSYEMRRKCFSSATSPEKTNNNLNLYQSAKSSSNKFGRKTYKTVTSFTKKNFAKTGYDNFQIEQDLKEENEPNYAECIQQLLKDKSLPKANAQTEMMPSQEEIKLDNIFSQREQIYRLHSPFRNGTSSMLQDYGMKKQLPLENSSIRQRWKTDKNKFSKSSYTVQYHLKQNNINLELNEQQNSESNKFRDQESENIKKGGEKLEFGNTNPIFSRHSFQSSQYKNPFLNQQQQQQQQYIISKQSPFKYQS